MVKQKLPLIKAGEKEVFEVEFSEQNIRLLETPLKEGDWYYLVFTNNNFIHGHDWMATVKFTNPVPTAAGKATVPSAPQAEDNTSQEAVEFVKSNFELQNPLAELVISREYNDCKENGEYVHAEVDLSAPQGTNIYPLSRGTVIKAEFDEQKGFYIVIDHGKGLLSEYTHCDELYKKEGDIAEMGEAIAAVGKTGMATGAHLGFGITLDGIPLNPDKIFIR